MEMHPLTPEFLQLGREIIEHNLDLQEWSNIESSDQFQSNSYLGGFDATEGAFTFSYYDISNTEYWFQLTLEEVRQVYLGTITHVKLTLAQK